MEFAMKKPTQTALEIVVINGAKTPPTSLRMLAWATLMNAKGYTISQTNLRRLQMQMGAAQ
jgi:hypothetical protein